MFSRIKYLLCPNLAIFFTFVNFAVFVRNSPRFERGQIWPSRTARTVESKTPRLWPVEDQPSAIDLGLHLDTCHLRHIAEASGQIVTIHLVLAPVMFSIDYCNSTLPGLLVQTTQRVHDAVMRLQFELSLERMSLQVISGCSWRVQFILCCIKPWVHIK